VAEAKQKEWLTFGGLKCFCGGSFEPDFFEGGDEGFFDAERRRFLMILYVFPPSVEWAY
jgi:hypothetical protein